MSGQQLCRRSAAGGLGCDSTYVGCNEGKKSGLFSWFSADVRASPFGLGDVPGVLACSSIGWAHRWVNVPLLLMDVPMY